jgi:8-amino-7-oxononanoate synthase
MNILDHYAAQLDALQAAQLRRTRRSVQAVRGAHLTVEGREMLAFCSNDYLGLAQHPSLVAAAQRGAATWGVGSTASPLVCGHSVSHEALERRIAAFLDLPRALYFYAGFAANAGLLPALAGRGDALFCDALNHASLIDGARLSRADIHIYPHNDSEALARLLADSCAPRKIIVTDAVFSMDGDVAPLPALLALAETHDALLLIDDAHGFGVLGPQGRGTAAHFGLRSPRLLVMGTLSKAAGAAGAFIAGDATLVELVMQRARSYVFATGAPAMVTEALRAAIDVIETEEWRRERLQRHVSTLRDGLRDADAGRLLPSDTPIQPIVIGDNGAALARMARLWERGLWVPAIRPPTVPAGTARLRVTLSAAHTDEDVDRLIDALRS